LLCSVYFTSYFSLVSSMWWGERSSPTPLFIFLYAFHCNEHHLVRCIQAPERQNIRTNHPLAIGASHHTIVCLSFGCRPSVYGFSLNLWRLTLGSSFLRKHTLVLILSEHLLSLSLSLNSSVLYRHFMNNCLRHVFLTIFTLRSYMGQSVCKYRDSIRYLEFFFKFFRDRPRNNCYAHRWK
jgi:hypothetical protein